MPLRHVLARLTLGAALALGLPLGLHAQPAPPAQPMLIEADALTHDQAGLVSVFSGNVVITQGTLLLRGQRAELRQDAQGNQSGVLQGAAGQRAFFRQQRPGLNELIEGEALRIEYDSATGVLRLIDQAVLRRLRAGALSDQASGSLIVINRQTERFSVEGGAAARTPDNPLGRVRAVITPRPDAPAPGAAPATPPSAPTPPLQPSPRLEPRR
jgi:lipopolysaccharide export system protein LptA